VVSIGQLDLISGLYRHRGSIGLDEPVHQRRRSDLRRRSPAAGSHQLFRRRYDRATENSQHLPNLENLSLSLFLSLESSELKHITYGIRDVKVGLPFITKQIEMREGIFVILLFIEIFIVQ
jgi:hypothetical protein